MAYWITVHYPHTIDGGIEWHVYLTDRYLDQGKRIRSGDQILFYCVQHCVIDEQIVTHVEKRLDDGSVKYVPVEKTAGGIVGVATARGGVRPKSELSNMAYNYGNSEAWAHYVPCEGFRRGKLVTREKYRSITGRGVASRTGLYQIHDDWGRRLVEALGSEPPPVGSGRPVEVGARAAGAVDPTSRPVRHLLQGGVTDAGRLLQRTEDVRGKPERNMEDVVKEFLVSLGHEARDITFQRGRIDIQVSSPDGGTHMVVEVKRELRTTMDAARRQGFDYANQVDAKLVILTDADHFEVYDRSRGGGYDAMRVGGFRLTKFDVADLPVLDCLRPEGSS